MLKQPSCIASLIVWLKGYPTHDLHEIIQCASATYVCHETNKHTCKARHLCTGLINQLAIICDPAYSLYRSAGLVIQDHYPSKSFISLPAGRCYRAFYLLSKYVDYRYLFKQTKFQAHICVDFYDSLQQRRKYRIMDTVKFTHNSLYRRHECLNTLNLLTGFGSYKCCPDFDDRNATISTQL